MSTRLTKSERSLYDALRAALPSPGDRLTPHRDGRQPWSLYSRRDRPDQQTWAAKTFHSLQDKGLIRIVDTAFCGVAIELPGPAELDDIERKTMIKVLAACKNTPDGRVGIQPGAHRMRYLPGDQIGRKESTYESIRDKGYVTIEFGSRGSTGVWWIRPTASGEGVA
ncbi:MAG: hypothetical protein ACQR33_02655 [Candidatus Saccharibacteria bacterium]